MKLSTLICALLLSIISACGVQQERGAVAEEQLDMPRLQAETKQHEIPKIGEAKYRLLVVEGVPSAEDAFNKVVINEIVPVNVGIDIEMNGAAVTGMLKQDLKGQLTFDGTVAVFTTSGSIKSPIELGKKYAPTGYAFSSVIFLFFIKFEEI